MTGHLKKNYFGSHGWRITVSNILEMTFCVRIEIKVNYKRHKLSMNWCFLRWGINLAPARHHWRRNHSWGRGDSDQLWLRINLCSALIGSPPELAFRDRSYWPALSTDLYHRSGTHFVSNSRGKHEEMRIFNRKKCTDHVLETKRLRTAFLCSWIWIWRGSSGLGFGKFPALGHPASIWANSKCWK